MARVTVEDCVTRIPNRFELVMLAAQRAREISGGAPISVDRDNDKNPVVALREIADATIDLEKLENTLIGNYQRHVEQDEPEEDDLEMLMRRELANIGEVVESAPAEEASEDEAPAEGGDDDAGEDDTPAKE